MRFVAIILCVVAVLGQELKSHIDDDDDDHHHNSGAYTAWFWFWLLFLGLFICCIATSSLYYWGGHWHISRDTYYYQTDENGQTRKVPSTHEDWTIDETDYPSSGHQHHHSNPGQHSPYNWDLY